MKIFETNTPEQTRALGREIAADLAEGSVIALVGDLGCGKTAFVKGIVDYFGDGEDVTSPTFTLVNEYDGDIPVYHFDVYRLENPNLHECDWMDDYLFGDGICLIEWADNIHSVLPHDAIRVEFKKDPERGENFREIKIC